MNTTRKVLLAGTAMAVAAIGNPALAQPIGNIIGGGAVVGANNGDNHCLDGSPATTGGYTVEHAPADTQHVASNPPTVDFTDQTLCTSFDSTENFTDAPDPGVVYGQVDSTGENDFLVVTDSGSASATGNVSLETTNHFNVTNASNPVLVGTTQTTNTYGNAIVGSYNYTGTVQTLQDALWEKTTTVSGNGTMGTGTQDEYLVTTGNIWFSETTGTSEFDPGTGNLYYTPTDGTQTLMDINGLAITTIDSVNGNETISYGADGIHNGTSYVDVNPDSVVIHGGTSSTTVTVDNAGISVADTTNGTTFTLGNTGDGHFYGNLAVDGFTTTNGIDNTGSLETDTLQVNGAANVDGFLTTHGQDNTGSLETDTLQVNGTSNFSGAITSNGIDNTGSLETDTLLVNGASTTHGITNTGAITTDTLTVNGAGSVGGTLTVGGAVIANGGVNTATIWNGTQNAGNGVTVADSLAVNGTVTGGNAAGNNVIGGSAATSSTLAAGTSYVQVNADNVQIHGGTNSTNISVSDAGVRITNNNTGASATANGTGGNLFIAADGSISSSNTAVAGGAVNINDGLVVGPTSGAALTGTGISTGTIRINTAGANKITGLANATLSATSTDAVTGQQLFATNQNVAANTLAISNLTTTVNNNFALLTDRANKAYQGVAMGFAMNAAPLALDNGEGGISGGVGYFQGEWAGAVKAQYVTDSGIGVGINVGFSEDAVGGGVGASIKF